MLVKPFTSTRNYAHYACAFLAGWDEQKCAGGVWGGFDQLHEDKS